MARPSEDECKAAAFVCELLAGYTRETEPYATNSIQQLEEAASLLYAEHTPID